MPNFIFEGKTGSSAVIFKQIDVDPFWTVSIKWTLPTPYLIKINEFFQQKKNNTEFTRRHMGNLFYRIYLNDEQLIDELYSIMIFPSTITQKKNSLTKLISFSISYCL